MFFAYFLKVENNNHSATFQRVGYCELLLIIPQAAKAVYPFRFLKNKLMNTLLKIKKIFIFLTKCIIVWLFTHAIHFRITLSIA